MTAGETIAAAINRINEKKKKLKKAYDDLQSHRSLFSPLFSLSWSEIDSHFSSLQSSLSNRFRLLQSAETFRLDIAHAKTSKEEEETVIRPELRALSERMDGIALSKFLLDRWDNDELPNPPSLQRRSVDIRRVFVLLMEALIQINAYITVDARERAKKLAYDWKTKYDVNVKLLEPLLFLYLVAAFELESEFSSEELSGYLS